MKLSKTKLSVLFSVIAVIAVFVCVKIVKVEAATSNNMYGYAWSSNIGWVKLNDCENPADDSTCTPASGYGVNVLAVAPGTISGYAWSSNLGWITFNSAGCPTTAVPGCVAGARADWAAPNSDGSVNIKGWARACSVYATGCSGAAASAASLGTWDGYIALDSANAGGTASGSWGWKINADHTIAGYAWGSEVIGWLKGITAKVYIGGPTAAIKAVPASVLKGGASNLTVTATNIDGATSCTIAGVNGLVMAQSGATWTGIVKVYPIQTTDYTVTCKKGTQSAKASTTVIVTTIDYPTGTPTATATSTATATATATGGSATAGTATGGGSGGSGIGGYCAIDYPQLTWDSDATTCTISEAGVGSTQQEGSSKAAGGSLGSDGRYYKTIDLKISGANSTYTMQCKGGTQSGTTSVVVRQCQKDFAIVPSPVKKDLVPSADGKSLIATFTVSIVPQDDFTGPVTLSLKAWPTNPALPISKTGTFDGAATETLTYSGGAYGTAQLTVSVPIDDLKQTATYTPIVIQGVSGALTRTASVAVGATVKIKPIFNEF